MTDNPLTRFIIWLRAGYPGGVPTQDHVPLLDLLQRKLTKAEVKEIVAQLMAESEHPVTGEQIEEALQQMILMPPKEKDIRRVAKRLNKAGWPLADDGLLQKSQSKSAEPVEPAAPAELPVEGEDEPDETPTA